MTNYNLDTTPLPPNNLVAQDPESAELAGYVRTKTFGRDVRESIARSIELNSTRSKNAEILANETVNVANDLTDRFNQQIGALTEDSEILDARGGFTLLRDRFEAIDEDLATRGVNIKMLGAKGDGVTDDTSIIQWALDNFKNIFFPEGTYLVSRTLLIRLQDYTDRSAGNLTGVNITGAGANKTKIVKVGNLPAETTATFDQHGVIHDYSTVDAIIAQENYLGGYSIKGIQLLGDGTQDYGLYISSTYRMTLDDVIVDKTKDNIRIYQAWLTNFRQVRSRNTGISYHIEGRKSDGSSLQNTSIHFEDTFAEYCKVGYKLVDITYSSGTSMACDFATEVGYDFKHVYMSISGMGFENGTAQIIRSNESNIDIGALYAMNPLEATSIPEGSKSNAKFEIVSTSRAYTGVNIKSGHLQGIRTSTKSNQFLYMSGGTYFNLENVNSIGLRNSTTGNTIDVYSTYNNITSERIDLMPRGFKLRSQNLDTDIEGYVIKPYTSIVGKTTKSTGIHGYIRSDLDGVARNQINIILSEIRTIFPNFFKADETSMPFKITVKYGDGNVSIFNLIGQTRVGGTNLKGELELWGATETNGNLVLTFSTEIVNSTIRIDYM